MTENYTNNISLTCPNCGASIPASSQFCSNCGQKQKDSKRPLRFFLQEFIATFFSFDARFWRTVSALCIPGKLTIKYFEGKMQTYAHPIRLFLTSSVILFAVLGYNGLSFLESDLSDSKFWKRAERAIYLDEFLDKTDSLMLQVAAANKTPEVEEAFDSLREQLSNWSIVNLQKDSSINIELEEPKNDIKINDSIRIHFKNLISMDEEEIIEFYKIRGDWMPFFVKQVVKVLKRSDNFANLIWSNFPLMLLFMMPGVALLLKLLYIRRGHYYIEHLIFSFHTHTFLFLTISFLSLISFDWLPDWVSSFIWLVNIGYLIFAMRNYYGQSFWKTFSKFGLLLIGYFPLLAFALIMTVLISALIF